MGVLQVLAVHHNMAAAVVQITLVLQQAVYMVVAVAVDGVEVAQREVLALQVLLFLNGD
jgi:hypothetical protein